MLAISQYLVFLFLFQAVMWRLRAEVGTWLASGCSRNRLESGADREKKTRPGSERCGKQASQLGILGLPAP